jgi:hypothetical protein
VYFSIFMLLQQSTNAKISPPFFCSNRSGHKERESERERERAPVFFSRKRTLETEKADRREGRGLPATELWTMQREAGKESVASLDELLLYMKKRKGQNLVQKGRTPSCDKTDEYLALPMLCCRRQPAVDFQRVEARIFFFFFLDLVCLLGQQQKSKAANICRRGNLLERERICRIGMPDDGEGRPPREKPGTSLTRCGTVRQRNFRERERGAALEGKLYFSFPSNRFSSKRKKIKITFHVGCCAVVVKCVSIISL